MRDDVRVTTSSNPFAGADFSYKPPDATGRARMFLTTPATSADYLDGCRAMELQMNRSQGSRWSVRGLVEDPLSPEQIAADLGFETPIEVSLFPTVVEGRACTYQWVSRNVSARIPDPSMQADILRKMDRLRPYQDALALRFHHESEKLIDKAAAAGLRLVCNDPLKAWGDNRVNGEVFSRLITSLFFYDAESAQRMLRGEGYSTGRHYLFELRNRDGSSLCFFMIAEWPWGFEATYTMIDGRYTGPAIRLGAARLLMLLSSALFLSRHGREVLVYGEANALNMRACIQAGYDGQIPRIVGGPHPVHCNIAWADHPVGSFGTPDAGPQRAPAFTERQYVHYGVGRLNPAKVEPFVEHARAFLDCPDQMG